MIDENILLQKLDATLLVETGEGYIKLCCIKEGDHSGVKIWNFEAKQNMLSILQENEIAQIISNGYKQVIIAFNNKNYSLVPQTFLNEIHSLTNSRTYLKDPDTLQLKQVLKTVSATVLFDVNEPAINLLSSLAPNATFVHSAGIFADSYKSSADSNFEAYIKWEHELLILSLFQKNKLVVLNSFDCKNATDAAYFLFNALEQFNFSIQDTQVSYTCSENDENSLFEILTRYIFKVSPLRSTYLNNEEARGGEHINLFNQVYANN